MSIEDSPFMKRAAKNGTNGHGKASEKRLAKSMGAKLTPNSGAMRSSKGDMKKGNFLIESKSTIHLSMSVEQAWLTKINNEAMNCGKMPALTVSFVTSDGKPRPGTNEWVMVPKSVFLELTEE
jgi:hypothetical protein